MAKYKIENIDDLRDVAIEALLDLRAGKIDAAEAGAAGKLCEGVYASAKLQLEYAKLNNRIPHIPFLGELKGQLLEGLPTRKTKLLTEK